jgi:hypothetical protein
MDSDTDNNIDTLVFDDELCDSDVEFEFFFPLEQDESHKHGGGSRLGRSPNAPRNHADCHCQIMAE